MSAPPELAAAAEAARPRRSRWRRLGIVFVAIVVLAIGVRLFLPDLVRWHVQRTLDRSHVYEGRIGDVSLHLWRGAYSIEDIRLDKTTGNVPVPLFAAQRVDLALEWRSLLNGKAVGRIVLEKPEMNFVDAQDEADDQTGAGGPWLEIIKGLFPFRINSTEVRDGSIHFRAFQTDPPVDVYLSDVQGSIENLTNIHDDVTPLISKVHAKALAMDHAEFEYEMKFDPFSYRPTFQLAVRLLGLDVTKTNALTRAYGEFDFEDGWFDLIVELDVVEGALEGYVKPMFRNLAVVDLRRDLHGGNVLAVFWEALVGVATRIFRNQPRDQVATVIPLTGDLSNPRSDVLATIGNILRNAFVRAYLPKLEGTASEIDGLTFGPARGPEDLIPR